MPLNGQTKSSVGTLISHRSAHSLPLAGLPGTLLMPSLLLPYSSGITYCSPTLSCCVHSQKYTFIRLIFIHSLKFSSSTVHPASLCDAWCTRPSPPLWLTVLLPPHGYMFIPCIQLPSPTRWPGLWFSQLWTTSATHSAYQYRGTLKYLFLNLFLSNLAVLIWTQTSKDVFQKSVIHLRKFFLSFSSKCNKWCFDKLTLLMKTALMNL